MALGCEVLARSKDRNKDEYIDGKDMDDYRKCLYDYYALTRGQLMKRYPIGYNDYWTLFREVADANNDGKLSKQEWLDVWTQINGSARNKSFKGLPQWVRLMPYVIFPIMDYKNDGFLDGEEYKTFWYEVGGIKADSGFIQHCLNVMTENGKHPLNMHRFQSLYADFYFSTSDNTPGRYMGGPVDYD